MRYFVRGPDGRLYGPADVPTLRDWSRADRLPPYAALIEEDTLREARADAVLGDPQTWPPPVPGTQPCRNCGRPVPARNGFCPYCGAGRQTALPTADAKQGCLIGTLVGVPSCLVIAAVAVIIVAVGAVALLLGFLQNCKNI